MRSVAAAPSEGAAAVLACVGRAEGPLKSFARESSLGAVGCTAATTFLPAAGAASGSGELWGAASAARAAGDKGAVSGGVETARGGVTSADCDAGGDVASISAVATGLTDVAARGADDGPAIPRAGSAGGAGVACRVAAAVKASASRAMGRASRLMTLMAGTLPCRVASTSPRTATVSPPGCGASPGPWPAAMKGGVSGAPGGPALGAKTAITSAAPMSAAPATANVEASSVQTPERPPGPRPASRGSREGVTPNAEMRGASRVRTVLPLGSTGTRATNVPGFVVSGACIGSASQP